MTIDPTTRAAIAELNARFSWALDLHDWSELREVLAPDVHYVSTGREFHDAESVIASFEGRTGARTTRHGLGNLLLRAGPGGTVLGRSSRHTSASNTEPVHGVPHPAETPLLRGFHRDRHRPLLTCGSLGARVLIDGILFLASADEPTAGGASCAADGGPVRVHRGRAGEASFSVKVANSKAAVHLQRKPVDHRHRAPGQRRWRNLGLSRRPSEPSTNARDMGAVIGTKASSSEEFDSIVCTWSMNHFLLNCGPGNTATWTRISTSTWIIRARACPPDGS
ncbi:nuclear transport factor 2 family protein [Streptomyces sp. NPDC059755]|uniref:nuclear transport factor 2 family protein n=1 Tax=Streptomyces sp. NPDC059755 TaxID=3346934 RepID=UPI00366471B1